MTNNEIQARDIRKELLKDGPEFVKLLKEVARVGAEEANYTGDLKTLHIVAKLLSPAMDLKDDKRKITEGQREGANENINTLVFSGDISAIEAQEYLKAISAVKVISEMDEIMDRLAELEAPK